LLLSTDIYGNTALHWVALNGKPDILQKIWDLSRDNLATEEIKNKLYYPLALKEIQLGT
jgi:ankyrin repeat protein